MKLINLAEALFWHASVGTRVDDSTNILGFDCGGEQLVCEICFNMGPLDQARALAGVSQHTKSNINILNILHIPHTSFFILHTSYLILAVNYENSHTNIALTV